MRVELIYSPGCLTYKQLLSKLETVIAEERLPIPVHCIESDMQRHLISPTIQIDGADIDELPVNLQGDACRLYPASAGPATTPCLESLRDVLWRKWKELTEHGLKL